MSDLDYVLIFFVALAYGLLYLALSALKASKKRYRELLELLDKWE